MFSTLKNYWYSEKKSAPTTISRFEKRKEFSPVLAKIQQLDDKAKSLLKEAGDDMASKAYRKYELAADLVKALREMVTAYNEAKALPDNPNDEIRELIRLAVNMAAFAKQVMDARNATLTEHRYSGRMVAASGILKISSYSAVYAASMAAAFNPIGIALSVVFGGTALSRITLDIAGTETKVPYTFVLLTELHQMLMDLAKNLSLKLNLQWDKGKPKPEIPKGLLCPISLQMMIDPVLFIVDGRTYERSNIVAALEKRKSSPYTGQAMTEEQQAKSIDELLIPNWAMRDVLEGFKLEHPVLIDEESQNVLPIQPVHDAEIEDALAADDKKVSVRP